MGEGNSKLANQQQQGGKAATANNEATAAATAGQASPLASSPTSATYYEAEKARMLHMRTHDQIEYDRSHDYHVEADRLLDIYRSSGSAAGDEKKGEEEEGEGERDGKTRAAGKAVLPKYTPPLIKASAQEKDILVNRREKINDEVLHHSQIFSPNRIPSHGVLRTLAQFQTLSMREGIAVHKTQEELNVLMKQAAGQVQTLHTCAQHELNVLHAIEASLTEAERLRQDVNMLESLVDDLVPTLEEIDALMSEEEKREVRQQLA